MIRPDDPWYPTLALDCKPGVNIRLKLAAEMMKSPYLYEFAPDPHNGTPSTTNMLKGAFIAADAMIAQANCEEENNDGK